MKDIDIIKQKIEDHQASFVGYKHEYAVLLPLVYYQDQWQILYEIRSQHITQPGEVAFPGGRLEAGESSLDAALRETNEEIGYPTDDIEILGEIDGIANGRVIVHCFVGVMEDFDMAKIKINHDEVGKVFLKPISYFLDQPAKYFTYENKRQFKDDFPVGQFKHFDANRYKTATYTSQIPYYTTEEEVIWGLTAELTRHFLNLIKN